MQLLDKQFYKSYGKVSMVVGLTVESVGPQARLNDLCKIYLDKELKEYAMAEVVGFRDSRVDQCGSVDQSDPSSAVPGVFSYSQ